MIIGEEKMSKPNFDRNRKERKAKTVFATIALIFVLSISSMLVASVQFVSAAKANMTLNVEIQNDPIGVNQPERFSVRFSPAIPTPTGQQMPATAELTKPDGSKVNLGPFNSPKVLGVGYTNVYLLFDYSPDQVGTWNLKFSWNGDDTTNPGSTEITFTVQSAPVDIVRKDSIAYLTYRPNPIGVGQSLLVAAWVTPRETLPGDTFKGFMFTFTKPDGTTASIGPLESFPDGTTYFEYTPDQVGQWTVEFDFPGDTYTAPCNTGKQTLTVQQNPIPGYPQATLPAGTWTFPVTPENKEWANIIGPYLQPTGGTGLGPDGTGSRYNAYSQGPNTAHILWKIPPVAGVAGVVGGQFGMLANYGKTSASVNVVMAGKGYYSASNVIHCVDIQTGEELWTAPGSYNFGAITGTSGINLQPELVSISSSRIMKYDALTGAVTLNMSGLGGVISYLANDGMYAYIAQRDVSADPLWGQYYLIKLDFTGTGTDLASRIIYNVTYPFNTNDCGICLNGDALTMIHFHIYGNSGGVNTTTGEVLWSKPIQWISAKPETVGSQNGVMFYPVDGRVWKAVDMKTGSEVWTSEQAYYPWGDFWAYGQADAYGMLYALSYGGVYAFDANTGKIVWHYANVDPYGETAYGQWPFGSADPIVADGKVYAPATEHSPAFYYKGWKLYTLDAYNGNLLWNILGYYSVNAIAEGVLQATNAYDGYAYAFGKGPTMTTVSTSSQVASKGNSILISGTVLDASAGQNGTAAVSDNVMSAWMEYLHMQQPKPTDATGVPVTITAVSPDGSTTSIATVTSDDKGNYATMWTPPTTGVYTIKATFAGSEAYWSSNAETTLGVSEAAAPSGQPTTPLPTQANAPGNIGLISEYIAIVAVVVVVAVIVAALALRKRKNQ
jgi:outer membrane protein assembly factor BamB